jgi:hypothetical protein
MSSAYRKKIVLFALNNNLMRSSAYKNNVTVIE